MLPSGRIWTIHCSPSHLMLILIHYQSSCLSADTWVCCVFLEQPSLQSGSPLCVLPPMIRLLPFLRLSLTRRKATWEMTGPAWLTLAALALAILLSCLETCRPIMNGWMSSRGFYCFFVSFSFHKCHTVLLPQTGWSWNVVGSTAG